MKKDPGGFIDFGGLDPDIEGAIGAGRQRQAARHMTPAQRRKAEKDRARNRRMIDIPPDLESQLESMAAELSVPFSSLVTWILSETMEVLDIDEMRGLREPSRSMRYEYILPYQKKPGRHRGRLR